MIDIEKPKIEIAEISEDNRYGKFICEPLERGYGTTFGNSLRRMLLSSLEGAAITSIRIDGVLHEFSTIPGVRDDVTNIVLNLKQLCLKMAGNEPKVIRIDVEGEKEVTAADIICDADIEILNPDLHIATVDETGKLKIEMTVERGRGYVPADKNKKPEDSIGIIPIDSIFSPVQRVNYTVQDTRVGNVTDYDKLILEVWTDGSYHQVLQEYGGTHSRNDEIEAWCISKSKWSIGQFLQYYRHCTASYGRYYESHHGIGDD